MQCIELLFIDYGSTVKSTELYNKLLAIDLDEGIKIESLASYKKVFVNKNASGIFVIQVVNNDEGKDDKNDSVRYLDSAYEVVKLVNSIFKKRFSIMVY